MARGLGLGAEVILGAGNADGPLPLHCGWEVGLPDKTQFVQVTVPFR